MNWTSLRIKWGGISDVRWVSSLQLRHLFAIPREKEKKNKNRINSDKGDVWESCKSKKIVNAKTLFSKRIALRYQINHIPKASYREKSKYTVFDLNPGLDLTCLSAAAFLQA